jgi:hypothetical protein
MADDHDSVVSLSKTQRKAAPGAFCVGILVVGLLCQAAVGQPEHPTAQAEVAKLLNVIGNADRVTVFIMNGNKIGQQIYASSDLRDLEALRASISIDSTGQWYRCACEASTVIRLFHGTQNIGEIDIFDGATISFTNWPGDVELSNKTAWFDWLDARGIKAPRLEFERRAEQGREQRAAEDRWIKAMPESLASLWPPIDKGIPMGPPKFEIAPLDVALSKVFPDKLTRILKLMTWFGSGAGPWSGYPSYESIAEQMLLEYSTPELLAAVSGETLDDREAEGAARLFAGWSFSKTRPNDNALLPDDLKRRLLSHSLESTDEDKRERAGHWLAAKVVK